jgi:2-C-methyl-D-erythritol 4-phosphate cytidylyltransferase
MHNSNPTNISSDTKMPVSLLLLSGGIGKRSGHHQPKQFYELQGHPMLAHSIIPATKENRIKEIITNAPPGYEERTVEIMQKYCGTTPFKVLTSGSTRQESCHALAKSATCNSILLHEAARPFVDLKMYKELLDCSAPNVGFCYPISYSMCSIDTNTKYIKDGVSRYEVFDIQLPQKFRRDTLCLAHELALEKSEAFNEDSVMVVKMTSEKVLSVRGSSRNLKITSQTDIVIAQQIMEKLND